MVADLYLLPLHNLMHFHDEHVDDVLSHTHTYIILYTYIDTGDIVVVPIM